MRKLISRIILIAVLAASLFAYNLYQNIFGSSVTKDTTVIIGSQTSFDDLLSKLSPFIKSQSAFKQAARLKKFSTPKAGRYELKKGMSNQQIINKIRIGDQSPVKVSFNNQDTLEKLAARIANQLEADSLAFLNAMLDPSFLKQHGFTKKSALGMYIPNQYDFYWSDTPKKFRAKMLKEYTKFWNSSRLAKAKKIGLSKDEVLTLASIVQKETAQKDERPIVAGLYLNRLNTRGWRLEADPTLIFALKEKFGHDKVYKRVLNKDKEINSPYNTYKHAGLPPTLIAMPDISAIDAVLNPKRHDYFFMCASTQKIGYHDFAKTLAQHNRNAVKYQRWISNKGIHR